MIPQKITNTSVIAAIAIALIALVVGLSQTHTTTAQSAPAGNNVYVFAEGVYPQATFTFKDATVTYDFQAFTHVSNLFGAGSSGFTTRSTTPEFTLQRVVGDTPYLHEAVDQTFENGGKTSYQDYNFKEFDVIVEFIQAGESVRTLTYNNCGLSNYKIVTEFDKEEGYTTAGKTGFAVMETYTFACNGYEPTSPTYDKMIQEQQNRKPYQ